MSLCMRIFAIDCILISRQIFDLFDLFIFLSLQKVTIKTTLKWTQFQIQQDHRHHHHPHILMKTNVLTV